MMTPRFVFFRLYFLEEGTISTFPNNRIPWPEQPILIKALEENTRGGEEKKTSCPQLTLLQIVNYDNNVLFPSRLLTSCLKTYVATV
jgi:hypothetical protein